MVRNIVMQNFFKVFCKKVTKKIWWIQKIVVPLQPQMIKGA